MKTLTDSIKEKIRTAKPNRRQTRAMVGQCRRHGEPREVAVYDDMIAMVFGFGMVGIETDGYAHM